MDLTEVPAQVVVRERRVVIERTVRRGGVLRVGGGREDELRIGGGKLVLCVLQERSVVGGAGGQMRVELYGRRIRRVRRTVRALVRGARERLVLVLCDIVVHVAQELDRLGEGGRFGGAGGGRLSMLPFISATITERNPCKTLPLPVTPGFSWRNAPGSSFMRRRFELEPDSDFWDSPSSPLMLYDWDATFSACCGDFIDSWSACICWLRHSCCWLCCCCCWLLPRERILGLSRPLLSDRCELYFAFSAALFRTMLSDCWFKTRLAT
uniref:Uncharacterized protein n=1 Tax=Anopheles farauti TaxID=69004 RepID=A0A182Q4S8_9DIPT